MVESGERENNKKELKKDNNKITKNINFKSDSKNTNFTKMLYSSDFDNINNSLNNSDILYLNKKEKIKTLLIL